VAWPGRTCDAAMQNSVHQEFFYTEELLTLRRIKKLGWI
jgi:hypothetical protein